MEYIESLRVFCAVVETKGIRRAAATLGTTPPTISRAIASLEARLGIRLFNRTTRQFSTTESADRIYGKCRRILDDLTNLEARITSATQVPTGVLRVAAHTTATISRLVPLISTFRSKYPEVTLDITLTERPVDLVVDGFDLGIVLPCMLASDQVVSTLLERMPLGIFATEGYLRNRCRPTTPVGLGRHTFVAMPPSLRKPALTFRGTGQQDVTVQIKYDIASNSPIFNREMVLSGLGIGALPIPLVQEDIKCGHLVRLLDQFEIKEGEVEIRLAYATRTLLPAKVKAFIDHANAFFGQATLS
ncbi:HTH-type transcriptional regulator PgrR [Paraburkholderia hiiakae]|uniref:HTH-type transcriptional regulator PgrR n=1 Tax=Paraburkholderia hiiakae TaxID=1081782 RepID=A0ABN7I2V9_9BURK|nr:LysR family transcriptional regulator [Paraburkholderia hiiakae]CAD6550395.1 HTH-type transcriptional regulator PgrR [Paraburkholderia hiiakae]